MVQSENERSKTLSLEEMLAYNGTMKYVRFLARGKRIPSYGLLEGEMVTELKRAPFGEIEKTGKSYRLSLVKLLSPVEYGKALCIGLNYRDHAKEFQLPIPTSPVVFMKGPNSKNDPDADVIYPSLCKRLDYEAELAVVIGKKCKDVQENEVNDYILGYCCANDVTARDLQPKQGQWTISKCFDGFLPLGPYISDEVAPENLAISSRVNGYIKQESNTSNLIFSVPYLVSYLSHCMTLMPGDVISTGTPGGISGMQVGDQVEVIIEGLGVLRNKIVKE